jgi:hypothetical protein
MSADDWLVLTLRAGWRRPSLVARDTSASDDDTSTGDDESDETDDGEDSREADQESEEDIVNASVWPSTKLQVHSIRL